MVNAIHSIFILKQVVLVFILLFKLKVLTARGYAAVLIVETMCGFMLAETALADRIRKVFSEPIV